MEPVAIAVAEQIKQHAYLERCKASLVITTRTAADGRVWATKTGEWPEQGCTLFLIRLAVELLCYAIARYNKLPMPECKILVVGGRPMWGVELVDGRIALGIKDEVLSPDLQAEIALTFQKDCHEAESYVRAVFLDVLMLNEDRTVSNVLHRRGDGRFNFEYFDHEQSLGWKNDIQVFGRNRIRSPEDEYRDLDRRLRIEGRYRWGARHTTVADRKDIFASLHLEVEMLDELRPVVVDSLGWLSKFQFESMKRGLAVWWAYLRAISYEELDARIFASMK